MYIVFRRLRRATRGQSLVEFALILPMLLFVMFAFWELSRAWNTYQVVTRAAREAARTYVVANGINTQVAIEGVANGILASAALDPANATITHPHGLAVGAGDPYSIRIEYPFDFALLRVVHNIGPGEAPWEPVTIAREVTMRTE